MCSLRTRKGKPVEADLSFGEVDEALYSVRPDTTATLWLLLSEALRLSAAANLVRLFLLGRGGHQESAAGGAERGCIHPRMAQVKPGSDLVVPKVRKAFPDTAYWNPECAHRAGRAREGGIQFS